MNRRLQYLLELEGLNQAQFADMIGVGRASISHILNGRNNPGYDIIQSILKKFPDINPDWLILGKGKPYREKSGAPSTLFDTAEGRTQSDNTISVAQENKPQLVENDKNNIVLSGSEPHDNHLNHDKPGCVQRKITRITVYYDDNTFEEFDHRKLS